MNLCKISKMEVGKHHCLPTIYLLLLLSATTKLLLRSTN